MTHDPQPVGVLIVRVWSEGTGPGSLRARVTSTPDINTVPEKVQAAATSQEVLELTRAFLAGWPAAGRR